MAQLGARVNGIHEVTGSTPVWSTTFSSRATAGLLLSFLATLGRLAFCLLDQVQWVVVPPANWVREPPS